MTGNIAGEVREGLLKLVATLHSYNAIGLYVFFYDSINLLHAGSFYIDSTHISFIFGSIFVDECRLLPCVYLCIILTFKYQLFASY